VIPNATANNYNAVINGNYSVLVTTSAGCSNSDTVSVNTALGAPVVILPPTISGCGSVNLDAGNPNSTYLWSPSGQTTQQISVSTANTYSVVVTNACGSSTGSTTVSINPSVTVPVVTNSGPTSFCAGGSVTITSSSAPVGGTYLWNTGATTQSISVNQTGNYFVTITNNQSCSATSAVTQVNVGSALPTPIITASGPTSFCPGGSVTLTSSYTSGNKWSPNNEQTQSITVFFSGSYTVSVTDAAGCVSTSAPTVVTVLTPPVALITANQPPLVCAGETIKLWADTTSTTSNVWNLSGAGATTDSITFTAQTGTVSYSVTATSTDGCTATSPVYKFTYIPSVNKPTITSSNSGAKCDGTITLTSSENTGNIWFNGATTQSITITTTERVWVKVRNAAGCEKTSDTTWFAATAGAPITITKDVEIYIPGNFNISEFGKKDGSINLTAVGGVAPLSFNWSGATTSTSEDLTNLGAGIYYLKVSDIVGCEVLDTIILKEPKEFKLPTGFSPNNDGKNDAYIIGAIEKYPDNKVEIFNRWGSVVWSIEGYNNADKIWNGTNNSGTDLPEGTYYVVVTFPNGNVETLKNYIDLKR
jgi:gliding motility-associated-like protein